MKEDGRNERRWKGEINPQVSSTGRIARDMVTYLPVMSSTSNKFLVLFTDGWRWRSRWKTERTILVVNNLMSMSIAIMLLCSHCNRHL
jgi:hypothetical protein